MIATPEIDQQVQQARGTLAAGQANLRLAEETAQRVRDVKTEAALYGREIDVYTVGVITCRPTQKDAEDYYRHSIVDNADWSAVDLILAKKNISRATVGEALFNEQRTNYANGMGGVPIVGDPDCVARQLADLSHATTSPRAPAPPRGQDHFVRSSTL